MPTAEATQAQIWSVSVVVVTWNCAATLDACLASVVASRPAPSQIICVDNGSTDGSVEIARAWGAEVIELGRNTGFPHAVNAALGTCRSEFVLLLNPDVVVDPYAIARGVDELVRDPSVGLIGANLRQPDGRPDLAAARHFRTLGLLTIETFGLTRLSRRFDRQYLSDKERSLTQDVPCVNGAFALVRAELLAETGGLDETGFLYLEDQQLCRDVADRGRRVRFVADALAVHQVSAATIASRPDQQHAAYIHRIDASVEIIHRIQGPWHRRAAVVLWLIRVTGGGSVSVLKRDGLLTRRYRIAARWLMGQFVRRQPPPPVPS